MRNAATSPLRARSTQTTRLDEMLALGTGDLSLTRALVSLGAIRRNAKVLRSRAGGAELMAVVKADAYGHGASRVARALQEDGVRAFAVATAAEGVRLRAAGIESRILVFGPPLGEWLPAFRTHRLEATVVSLEAARMMAAHAEPGETLCVHLKVDTGMHRYGISPEHASEAIAALHTPGIELAGVMTHYASADEPDGFYTSEQAERFAAVRTLIPDVPAHAQNSDALIRGHGGAHGAQWVRTGVALYGLLSREEQQRVGVEEAMRFSTRVTQMRDLSSGEGVSYTLSWRTDKPTRVATIGAGYADGVPRLLTNRGEIGLGGQRVPIRGNVCMDALVVEVGPDSAVREGDEAILMGPGGPSAHEVSVWAETISYEVACRVGQRVARVWTDE